MAYLLSPKVDFVFKNIFGNEKHINVLISFLNAVMKSEDPIKSVQIRNSKVENEHIDDKYSRLYIRAVTNKCEPINIEIQMKNEFDIIKRSLYSWSKIFENQMLEGDNYNKLEKTVCINILNMKYLENDNFHNMYRLREVNRNEELTDTIELHFIEIPKLKELKDTYEISDMLEAWVEFIKNPYSEIVEKLEMNIKEIKEAKLELIKMSACLKYRDIYEKRRESMIERISALNEAERKGIQKGIAEGEKNKAIEIAKSLLDVLDIETISLKTGLSIDEINNINI